MDLFIVYGLVLISLIISIGAQIFVSSSYKKYLKVSNERNISGAEAARELLIKNNISDVSVVETSGFLSDHYDPKNKVIRLSHDNYVGCTISSVSVACHECGHAIQDKDGYLFMRFRSKLIPFVNFSSYAGYLAITLGMFTQLLNLVLLGIMLEMVILLFQIVTLPVEFDASRRALKQLDYAHFFNSKELKYGRKVLTAAALTYVASVATTLIQIVRLIFMVNRKRR